MNKELREKVARKGHDIYERLAPDYGYKTREDTKDFDPESPNGRLMIAVYGELINMILDEVKEDADNRLLNAFQLVKNGIKISTLKFPEFKKLMETKHDHNGKPIKSIEQLKGNK